jgi:hypothetical protein
MDKLFSHLADQGKRLLQSQIQKIKGKVTRIFVLGASFRNERFFEIFQERLPGFQIKRIEE